MDHKNLRAMTDLDIIKQCHNAQAVLNNEESSVRVVRILGNVLVKYGYGVQQDEAETLRYFVDDTNSPMDIGYIVMEYIEGINLENVSDPQILQLVPRVATAIQHISDIPIPLGTPPGPLGGGEPKGYLWSDYGACTTFRSLDELEEYLNEMLRLSVSPTGSLTIKTLDLVMCHMDIAPRNILLTSNDEICLVDWGLSGFYPFCFQIHNLVHCRAHRPVFFEALLERVSGPEWGSTIALLCEASCLNKRYVPMNLTTK